MAGGQVEFSLPSGWTIIKALADIAAADEKVDSGETGDPLTATKTIWLKFYEHYGPEAPATP